jgi:hypothetical protein
MLPKRGIFECFDRCEQHIDQIVLKPIKLMRDEGDQVDMNIVNRAAPQIGRAHSGDAARKISNGLRAEVQNGQHRLHFGVKLLQNAEIDEPFADFSRPCRLRQSLEKGESVWGLARSAVVSCTDRRPSAWASDAIADRHIRADPRLEDVEVVAIDCI